MHVKLCGMTNAPDVRAAIAAGVDLLGFILVPDTPRYVAEPQVRALVAVARDANPAVRLVGVYMDRGAQEVAESLARCGLDLAQLHGAERPETVAALAGRAYKTLKPLGLAEALSAAARFAGLGVPGGPALLLDTPGVGGRGGTGRLADWTLAAELAGARALLLAGGLRPENVAAAIERVRPWGVDVCSGIEARPGKKDGARLRAFVAAARGSAAEGVADGNAYQAG